MGESDEDAVEGYSWALRGMRNQNRTNRTPAAQAAFERGYAEGQRQWRAKPRHQQYRELVARKFASPAWARDWRRAWDKIEADLFAEPP